MYGNVAGAGQRRRELGSPLRNSQLDRRSSFYVMPNRQPKIAATAATSAFFGKDLSAQQLRSRLSHHLRWGDPGRSHALFLQGATAR